MRAIKRPGLRCSKRSCRRAPRRTPRKYKGPVMFLEPELRRKLSRMLTPAVLQSLEMDLTSEVLTEAAVQDASRPLAERTAQAVQRIEGIRYVFGKLAELSIEPLRSAEGPGAGLFERGNGDGRAAEAQ